MRKSDLIKALNVETVEQCRKECYEARFLGDACAGYTYCNARQCMGKCRLQTANTRMMSESEEFESGIMEPGM